MADDDVRAPGLAALVAVDPALGKPSQPDVEQEGRASQERDGFVERERAARAVWGHAAILVAARGWAPAVQTSASRGARMPAMPRFRSLSSCALALLWFALPLAAAAPSPVDPIAPASVGGIAAIDRDL